MKINKKVVETLNSVDFIKKLIIHIPDEQLKILLFGQYIQDNPVSSRTLQTIFKDASNRVGISKKVSIHTLRHCFATHMLNDGANIVAIKDLLGHSNIDTTCKYLHLTHSQVLGVKNPFDVGGIV